MSIFQFKCRTDIPERKWDPKSKRIKNPNQEQP